LPNAAEDYGYTVTLGSVNINFYKLFLSFINSPGSSGYTPANTIGLGSLNPGNGYTLKFSL
jgi:hypothetical protein